MAGFSQFFPEDAEQVSAGVSLVPGHISLEGSDLYTYIGTERVAVANDITANPADWKLLSACEISDLSDVNTENPAPVNGDIMIWNPMTEEWVVGSSNTSRTVPTYPFIVPPVVTAVATFSADRTSAVLSTTVVDGDQPVGTPFIYQWALAGTDIAGETNPTFTPTVSGRYSVDVTDADGNTVTAIVDIVLNQPAVVALTITSAATIDTDQRITGTISVADADNPTDVTWALNIDGVPSGTVAGTGDVTGFPFDIPSGAAGTRTLTLIAEDPQGAVVSGIAQTITVLPAFRTATFSGTNSITGPVAAYTLADLAQADQVLRIGTQYRFNDIVATINGGYQIDTAFVTSGDALSAPMPANGVTVNRDIAGAVSAISRTVTFTLVNQITGPAAGYTISNGTQASQTGIIGDTWNFIQPSVAANAGHVLNNLMVTVTQGALTGTIGATAPDNIIVTLTGESQALSYTATLSLTGTAANVTASGGIFSDTGTIGQPYTLELPTLTPDPGYTIGTAAYGGGSGALMGTFGAADVAVTRVLSGAGVGINRNITFTFVNNIQGLANQITLSDIVQAAQSGIIGDTWNFIQPTFSYNAGHTGNVVVTVTQGTLTGTIGANAPQNVVVTATGAVMVSPTFTATASYNLATFPSAGGTPAISDFTTNIMNPVVTAIPANNATDGQSFLSNTRLGNIGGVTTTGAFGTCGGLSPATTQVFTGVSFTQNGTQTAPTATTALRSRTRYTNVQTATPANTNIRTQTVTVTGVIPSGFVNAGNAVSVMVAIQQLGDTALPTPNQTAPCGTLTPGTNCIQETTITAASTGTASRGCNSLATGTGTLSVNATASSATVDVGDPVTFTASNPVTNFVGGLNYTYTWTLTGGGLSGTRSGQSITVTPTAAGQVTASVVVTAPGGGGSTFTATDTARSTANPVGCNGSVTGSVGGACTGFLNAMGVNFNHSSSGNARTGYSTAGRSAGDTIPTSLLGPANDSTCIAANGNYFLYPTDANGVICAGTGVRFNAAGASFFPASPPTITNIRTFTIS